MDCQSQAYGVIMAYYTNKKGGKIMGCFLGDVGQRRIVIEVTVEKERNFLILVLWMDNISNTLSNLKIIVTQMLRKNTFWRKNHKLLYFV